MIDLNSQLALLLRGDYGFGGGLREVEDLTRLQRLQKYLDSDNIFNRQMLARSLLETLRSVYESNDNCVAVLDAMVKLSEDPEPSVRSELMEQVPHIAVYCQENRHAFTGAVPQYILPMVVRYLSDSNSQVRKTCQAALLVLLEQDLVEKSDIEDQVVHVILELASPESLDDYRSEAAALMSKMALLLGKGITERLLLPRFSELCTDPLYHVRKVCAANFGEVASVVGVKNCEDVLLPKFFYLCEDGVWGVRKACAECFMSVSCACSLQTRRTELANLFVNLLCDQSRWVRMSAFQQLGPFISTFADTERTGLFVNEDGSLSFRSIDSFSSDESFEHSENKDVSAQGVEIDLSGMLRLSSLDPSLPSESDTDDSAALPSGQGDADISNNSHGQDEDMVLEDTGGDEDGGGQQSSGRLVFNLDDKSVEELRSESVGVATSVILGTSALECSQQQSIEAASVQNQHNAQQSSCDIGGKPSDEHPISCSVQNIQSRRDEGCVNCGVGSGDREGESPAVTGSGDRVADSASTAGSGDTLPANKHCKLSSNCRDQSDSDSVFIDGSKPTDDSVHRRLSGDDSGVVHVHLDNNFNTFQYWRSPLPEVNIDFDIINGQPTNIHVVAKVKDDESRKVYASEMSVSISGPSKNAIESVTDTLSSFTFGDNMSSSTSSLTAQVEKSGVRIHTASVSTVSDVADETVSNIGSTHVLGQHLGEQHLAIVDGVVQDLSTSNISFMDEMPSMFGLDGATLAQQQNIVPQLLLENYLGMVDPSRAQTVDGEITKHCAYNLPAVAFTLGRQNWHCIRNLYETLAQDMQWKVRRTLAFSMHELAMIVGDEITHKDLVPVFDGFLKDLDEVRIGVLKHLADIFRLLRPEVRLQYLARTHVFMKADNQRNWRFREELAEQLILVCDLFHCLDVVTHIVPLAMMLLSDKVAQVRFVALRLLSAVLRKTYLDVEKKLLASVCNNIIEQLVSNNRWLTRQTFAQLCYVILEDDSLPPETFARNFLPSLLSLVTDSVPNVRLSLAKVMTQRIMPLDYFTSQQNPYHEDLVDTQQKLQSDADKDVRYFATQQSETLLPHDHDMVPV
ncbi:hypothetical protein BsWGS_22242 [Bradybaena similaris]